MKKILAYLLLVNFNIFSAEYTLEYNPAKIDAKAEYFIIYGSENGISTQFNATNTKPKLFLNDNNNYFIQCFSIKDGIKNAQSKVLFISAKNDNYYSNKLDIIDLRIISVK